MRHQERQLDPGRTIPATSVRQPWATLITRKQKKWLTRAWSPSPRRLNPGEEVAIHSSNEWTVEQKHVCQQDTPERRALILCQRVPGEDAHTAECLPRGRVLSICTLQEVIPVEEAINRANTEKAYFPRPGFVDYSERRYAWRLEVEYIYHTPPSATGNRPLWQYMIQPDHGRN